MPKYEVNGNAYEVDEEGFLEDPSIWTREVAGDFGLCEGISELTPEHWKIIDYIRGYYVEHGTVPLVRKLCNETGFKLNRIYDLFPSGPAKGACKVAGIPKPTGCV